jgi:Cysteine-rich CPCC
VDNSPVRRHPKDDPALSNEEIAARRVAWFHAYIGQRNVFAPAGESPYTCPCCGHATLTERGAYEICSECGWEDDGQDEHDSAVVRGGPNGPVSLDQARRQYIARGGTRRLHHPPNQPV